jgi:hypothetical protein
VTERERQALKNMREAHTEQEAQTEAYIGIQRDTLTHNAYTLLCMQMDRQT